METKLTSTTREVIISNEQPTVLIGERINPTGSKKLTKALQNGDLVLVRKEALNQVQAGANTKAGLVVIEAIRRIKAELGVNLTLGVSNISFGLPDRSLLNSVFLKL